MRRTNTKLWLSSLAAGLVLAGCGGEPLPGEEGESVSQEGIEEASATEDPPEQDHDENILTPGFVETTAAAAAASSGPITNHGGPVMLGTVNIYYIWYGTWTAAVPILQDLATNIGGSAYYNINKTYKNTAGQPVTGQAKFVKAITDNYSLGKSLTDAQVRAVVTNAITKGQLPKDGNGVYFVLTAPDVVIPSGMCKVYCGWHTYTVFSGTTIKYSLVGATSACPTNCSAGQQPNGNLNGDGMASVLVHELSEMVSDPTLNAWYDASGQENADKCAWTFGTRQGAAGKQYNVKIGARNFLLQQNWVNTGAGRCGLQ